MLYQYSISLASRDRDQNVAALMTEASRSMQGNVSIEQWESSMFFLSVIGGDFSPPLSGGYPEGGSKSNRKRGKSVMKPEEETWSLIGKENQSSWRKEEDRGEEKVLFWGFRLNFPIKSKLSESWVFNSYFVSK